MHKSTIEKQCNIERAQYDSLSGYVKRYAPDTHQDQGIHLFQVDGLSEAPASTEAQKIVGSRLCPSDDSHHRVRASLSRASLLMAHSQGVQDNTLLLN